MSRPLKETKAFRILREIELAGRGLTNREVSERIAGVSDSRHPEYMRIRTYLAKLEKRGYLKKVGYEPDPLNQDHPIRDIAERGKNYLKLAREGATYEPKVSLER